MTITVREESVETKTVKKSRDGDGEVVYKVTMKSGDGSKVVITTPNSPFVPVSDIGKNLTL